MKLISTLLLTVLFCIHYAFPQQIELELFASGFNRPVSIKHAGDDRLFVVEQDGIIKIINSDGSVQSTSFLNIDDRVINTGNERGLLGLAFHPDYANNRFFYVNYINNSGDTVVSRFTRDEINASIADPNSEFQIITYAQPFSNHNGGDMAFGPDGYLYISSGDGGSGGDPLDNGQDQTNLLGKLLRIDVDTSTPAQNYGIPPDNPNLGDTPDRAEIWAYGLRNPWKFSFDRLNGDLWIGDVGQGQNEEINRATVTEAGVNYGWRCYEGNSSFDLQGCSAPGAYRFPEAEYNHFNDGEFKCSITGGYRYRGTAYPSFEGLYFFADFCSEEIGFIAYNDNTETWDMTFQAFEGSWSTFGETVDGELLIADLQGGAIYQMKDANLSTADIGINRISIYPNPAKNELYIDFNETPVANSSVIMIYDLKGQIVKQVAIHEDPIQKIDTSEISSGIYMLKISTKNGGQNIQKLVIN